MTDVLSKEFSRKAFLKGGGALVVGFSTLGAGIAGKSEAAEDPYASNPPATQTIDSWIAIHADNTATLKTGIVELGQGTLTGLLMIAADELDLTMAQMRYVRADTNVTPNQGGTSASAGTKNGGRQVRAAAAAARSALLDLATANLGVARASLVVEKGVVSGGGRSVTYGALVGDKLFNVSLPASYDMDRLLPGPAPGNLGVPTGGLAAGAPGTKSVSQYRLVGTRVPRVDIPDKVTGKHVYVHNIRVPGMLHGRVVRPRGQGAYGSGTAPKIVSVDERSIRHIPGARVVRHADFLGVVAEQEYAAIQAAAQLKVTWADMPVIAGAGNLWKQMRDFDTAGQVPATGPATVDNRATLDTVNLQPLTSGDTSSALASAAVTLSQTYKVHYNAPVPIGPGCCVADVTPNGARIFSNPQGVNGTAAGVRAVLAQVMGSTAPPMNRIRVTFYEGASSFGSGAPGDAIQAAAVMSALVGKPVRLQFMRWDEHGWGNHGPAMMFDMRAGVDSNGKLVAVEHTDFIIPYAFTNPAQQQVTGSAAFGTSAAVFATISSGLHYGIPNRKTIVKTLPLKDNYFRSGYFRSPYRFQTGFAAEQLFDELAYAAKIDPYQFRLLNIATTATDPQQRWRNVLANVAALSNWKPRVAASNLSKETVVSGRGIALGFDHGTVAAAVADIEVNTKTGKITTKHVYCCVEPGVAINPAGAQNNLEGEAIQGASRVIGEQLVFDTRQVTSIDWATYPIMRFKDAPKVTLKVLSRTDIVDRATGSGSHSGGAGESPASAVAGAIPNAFFDATGVRIREAPMTPGRVRAVLKAAGK